MENEILYRPKFLKRPFLYYLSLVLILFIHDFLSAYIGKKFGMKLLDIQLLAEFILLLFLYVQYLVYLTLNKENNNIVFIVEPSDYCEFYERKNTSLSIFFQGKNSISIKPNILFTSFSFFILMSISGNYIQALFNPILSKITIFVDFSVHYIKAIKTIFESNKLLSFLLIVFLGPFLEELTFRGFSLSIWHEKKGKIIITIFMSFVFALVHFDFSRIFGILFMGLALGFIYNITESLLYPIIIHVINNGISYLSLYLISLDENFIELEELVKSKLGQKDIESSNLFIIAVFAILFIWSSAKVYKKLESKILEKY